MNRFDKQRVNIEKGAFMDRQQQQFILDVLAEIKAKELNADIKFILKDGETECIPGTN